MNTWLALTRLAGGSRRHKRPQVGVKSEPSSCQSFTARIFSSKTNSLQRKNAPSVLIGSNSHSDFTMRLIGMNNKYAPTGHLLNSPIEKEDVSLN
jgi:hypothetical protein